jgi:hypothetical protein
MDDTPTTQVTTFSDTVSEALTALDELTEVLQRVRSQVETEGGVTPASIRAVSQLVISLDELRFSLAVLAHPIPQLATAR